MNILSCFDGISGGQIALNRAGIKYSKYYASEIDKYAIKITQANYPDTIQLGSITDWRSWDIEKPDIIIGGSPCQGFSFAGKQLNFEDPRSKLFFTFVDILKHYKPTYFLLENVIMAQQHNDVISQCLGEIYPECVVQGDMFSAGRLEPIEINSALVSAQNRRRLYWTNIPNITQPDDKGILLKDIIEGIAFINNNGVFKIQSEKANCIDANYHKGIDNHGQRTMIKDSLCIQVGTADINGNESIKRICSDEGKCPTLTAVCGGNQEPKIACCIQVGKTKEGGFESGNRIYSTEGKNPSLLARCHKDPTKITDNNITWRKLTPVECERLQTVPDNYTAHVSNSRRYHALGNSFTVDVIVHILKQMEV